MKYKVTLNNKVYEVEVEKGEAMLLDEYEAFAPPVKIETPKTAPEPVIQPVEAEETSVEAAPAAAPSVGGDAIESPLPGSILSINVEAGSSVKAGDILLIIEAMKMENEITAPRAGKVLSISVSRGQMVETGDVLLNLE
ncbi:MAG: acetyl-CoA carboxylase biotin carboxyl carrier protein subunit [Ruminococcaceae bacterium]|nr:acetyl-CoA carboxylase biotin carboxyl carrier protein subunit [Oscillospiraceae bacterium]